MSSEVEKGAVSQTKSKLWVDILIFVAFLITMEPGLSRLTIHEWLKLIFRCSRCWIYCVRH